jgi:cation transport ATPase
MAPYWCRRPGWVPTPPWPRSSGLVQEAQNSKAPGQPLADRAAFWLVLVALVGGGLTFAVWALATDRPLTDALLFAITVVVITCPDALRLAAPPAIMIGTGLGAWPGDAVQERHRAGDRGPD